MYTPVLSVPPLQSITDWAASTTETNFLTALEAGSLQSRCLQGWFLLRGMRGEFVSGLLPLAC